MHIGLGIVITFVQQKLGQIAAEAGAHGNQPLVMLFQQGIVNPGFIVKPVGKPGAHQLHQVLIALLVFAQEDQMAVFFGKGALIPHVGTDVYLAPDHRMNAVFFTGGVKINGTVKHPVVGDGTGGHLHVFQALYQMPDAAGAVQQAVFRVQVQMCKAQRLFPPCVHIFPTISIPQKTPNEKKGTK